MIADVIIHRLEVHSDDRGSFVENFRQEWMPTGYDMVQSNVANRKRGTLVGLHYHLHQADYWYVPQGQASIVLHDLRIDSPTENQTVKIEASRQNEVGIFIPPGVAHGFYARTDMTINYMVSSYYNPDDELGVTWNDPEWVWIWPNPSPDVSDRDATNPLKSELKVLRRY